jgi:hypothetical protein
MVVIDIDPAHGGDASLDRLLRQHGPLPPGRTIRTGSGGRHLYLAHPGQPVPNDTGRRLGAGIDVRGDGGYVVAPPSRHISGDSYSVVSWGRSLPDLPPWLRELLLRHPEPFRPPKPELRTTTGPPEAWAEAALRAELRRLRVATVGTRNHTLNRIAFRIGQIVGAGHLDAGVVEPVLLEGAGAIGLGSREAMVTIRSGLRAGVRSPRGPRSSNETPGVDLPPM